jgi:Ankyrin repeat.
MIRNILFAVLCGLTFAAQAQTTLGANEPPIFDAARIGSAAEVDKILKANPAMRDARNQLGSTPLHLAATNLDSGPLKVLIAAGAEVNARDKEDNTPLHMAAYVGRSDAARCCSKPAPT